MVLGPFRGFKAGAAKQAVIHAALSSCSVPEGTKMILTRLLKKRTAPRGIWNRDFFAAICFASGLPKW